MRYHKNSKKECQLLEIGDFNTVPVSPPSLSLHHHHDQSGEVQLPFYHWEESSEYSHSEHTMKNTPKR
jgi:hypothetical protein